MNSTNDDAVIFSENDIRPHELMKGQQSAIQNDLKKLLSRAKEFVEVDCPACESKSKKYKFSKNGFHYVECVECETFYENPRPSPEVLEDFLKHSENYAYWDKYIFPASEETRRQRIFIPRVDRLIEFCRKYNVPTEALLEVGAGHGTFCEELNRRKLFKRVVGVEPSTEWAATCKKRGVEVLQLPIEKVDPSLHGIFDIVTNFEVIEHLFSPRGFIEQCYKFLRPGGLFVLTCPNGKGFDVITLKELSSVVDHEHLNYFNPDSLSNLLTQCGLEVLESQTPGVLDADLVRTQILEGKFDVSSQPFLKRTLIDEWDKHGGPFQRYLQQQGLSSNMWIIARKPLR